jgi:hypothetical protein
LPSLESALNQRFGQSSTDLSVRTINISKSAMGLLPEHFPAPYSEHANIGVQHEVFAGMALTADLVLRQSIHTLFDGLSAPDYNHFNAARGPVIPKCVSAQTADPGALCSTGPITVWTPGGRERYLALLLKASRQYTRRYQFTVSYALAAQTGFSASNGFANLDDWFANYGAIGSRHVLNLSGIADLRWGFHFSFFSVFQSKAPAMPWISGIDLSGSGTSYSNLPGVSFNCFNRGCGTADLARLTSSFNQEYAGTFTSRGQLIPHLSLPSAYRLGDNFASQDVRLGKMVALARSAQLDVFGEVFNLFNVANLSGYSFNLNSPGFGQPTQRVSQIFGSGGPRALQVGARLSF